MYMLCWGDVVWMVHIYTKSSTPLGIVHNESSYIFTWKLMWLTFNLQPRRNFHNLFDLAPIAVGFVFIIYSFHFVFYLLTSSALLRQNVYSITCGVCHTCIWVVLTCIYLWFSGLLCHTAKKKELSSTSRHFLPCNLQISLYPKKFACQIALTVMWSHVYHFSIVYLVPPRSDPKNCSKIHIHNKRM